MCNLTSAGLHTKHCRAVVLALERLSVCITVSDPRTRFSGALQSTSGRGRTKDQSGPDASYLRLGDG